jgi:hypothetical protein
MSSLSRRTWYRRHPFRWTPPPTTTSNPTFSTQSRQRTVNASEVPSEIVIHEARAQLGEAYRLETEGPQLREDERDVQRPSTPAWPLSKTREHGHNPRARGIQIASHP